MVSQSQRGSKLGISFALHLAGLREVSKMTLVGLLNRTRVQPRERIEHEEIEASNDIVADFMGKEVERQSALISRALFEPSTLKKEKYK